MKYKGHNFKQIPRANRGYPTMGMMTFVVWKCKHCNQEVVQLGPEALNVDSCKKASK